jgi:hypothetical protein
MAAKRSKKTSVRPAARAGGASGSGRAKRPQTLAEKRVAAHAAVASIASRVAATAPETSPAKASATELADLASRLGTASPPPPDSAIQRDTNFDWQNYGQNLSATVATYYLVSNGTDGSTAHGLSALRAVVQEVEQQGGSLAPVGSRWCFSPAAVNTGAMVDVTRMAIQMPFSADQVTVDPATVIHLQAGTTIQQLLTYVESAGRELLGMGGNCGQTVGGVISTGSHGGFRRTAGFPDAARALFVVAEKGDPYWLERASRPLVSAAFATSLAQAGVAVLREDDLFNDAVIGLGAFGVLNSVVLDTAPAYFVALDRSVFDLDDKLRAAFFQGDFGQIGRATEPLHFEVVVNPFRCSRGTDGAWRGTQAAHVTLMDKIPVGTPTTDEQPGSTLNDGDLGQIVATFAQLAPVALPPLVDLLIPVLYPNRMVHGPLSWANPLSTTKAPTISLELGVSSDSAAHAFDATMDGMSATGFRLPGAIGMRQTAQSSATLSVAQWPLTFTFEFACLDVAGTADNLTRLLDYLERVGVAFSLNLGQIVGGSNGPPWLALNGRLNRIYGADRVARWKMSRARLCPSGSTFQNQLTRVLGLT